MSSIDKKSRKFKFHIEKGWDSVGARPVAVWALTNLSSEDEDEENLTNRIVEEIYVYNRVSEGFSDPKNTEKTRKAEITFDLLKPPQVRDFYIKERK